MLCRIADAQPDLGRTSRSVCFPVVGVPHRTVHQLALGIPDGNTAASVFLAFASPLFGYKKSPHGIGSMKAVSMHVFHTTIISH